MRGKGKASIDGVPPANPQADGDVWSRSTPASPAAEKSEDKAAESTAEKADGDTEADADAVADKAASPSTLDKGKEKEHAVRKFRGIPEDVKLFEVFWHQVVELIKVS